MEIAEKKMELYLQFGWGMMGLTKELLSNWSGGRVILSPRDLEPQQISRFSREVSSLRGEVLIDPQCYARGADHHRLLRHEYFQIFTSTSSSSLLTGAGAAQLLSALARLVAPLGIRRHILPGLLTTSVDDLWFALQERIIGEAPNHLGNSFLLATIALSSDSMLDEAQVEAVIDRASGWPVNGFYIVAESPSGYLVDRPMWLANLLILASGLKLLGKEVIVGYCNHQSLCLAVANVDAVASGTYLNVRNFPPDKFYMPASDEVSRKTTWYYCPHAFSEYTIPFLDMAKAQNVLEEMRCCPEVRSNYADSLFTGPDPSSMGWREPEAFRHYLTCLRSQVAAVRQDTYDETITFYRQMLSEAETILRRLDNFGIYGRDRDFRNYIDVNRSALVYFDQARGHQLRRNW
jgi:hypothetical protein